DAAQATFGTKKGPTTRTPIENRHYLLAGRLLRRVRTADARPLDPRPHLLPLQVPQRLHRRHLDRPKNIYVKEDAVVHGLDEWLAELFDDDHLHDTCTRLAGVSEPNPDAQQREAELRAAIADCDRKLPNYRALLDHEDAVTVAASWIADTQRERKNLEHQLGHQVPGDQLTPNRSKHTEQVTEATQLYRARIIPGPDRGSPRRLPAHPIQTPEVGRRAATATRMAAQHNPGRDGRCV
ncbi:MAG TPA: hypothetical protein VGA62_12155, partial [Acidimicrobiia bacterium]